MSRRDVPGIRSEAADTVRAPRFPPPSARGPACPGPTLPRPTGRHGCAPACRRPRPRAQGHRRIDPVQIRARRKRDRRDTHEDRREQRMLGRRACSPFQSPYRSRARRSPNRARARARTAPSCPGHPPVRQGRRHRRSATPRGRKTGPWQPARTGPGHRIRERGIFRRIPEQAAGTGGASLIAEGQERHDVTGNPGPGA